MNRCKDYSCYKGISKCSRHPEYEPREFLSGCFNVCDLCKKRNGGIYPYQVPILEIDSFDVLDENGQILFKTN